MISLGIESTAWNFSVGVVDENEIILVEEEAYQPREGGIHPREAAQHHSEIAGKVLRRVFKRISPEEIELVSFSQGPGMGPCLRIGATVARTLALSLGKPLVGVNHCLAHVEIGKWLTDAENPVTLYVSGGNSQIIAKRGKRYRVFGETLDIGIGNAIDKFARFLGLQHPGGPKIEKLAEKGSKYIEMPYSVKGMDFSFSGLVTHAMKLVDEGYSKEDVAFSFQETAFSMLTEVTERAMAYLDLEECLLVGGVGANMRLQEMLRIMCEERNARFYAPDKRYMGDNGAMIAYTAILMYRHGMEIRVEESYINPDFRIEEVEVGW